MEGENGKILHNEEYCGLTTHLVVSGIGIMKFTMSWMSQTGKIRKIHKIWMGQTP